MLKIKEREFVNYLFFLIFFFIFFSKSVATMEIEAIVLKDNPLTIPKRQQTNLEGIEFDGERFTSQYTLEPSVQENLSTHFLNILSLKIYGYDSSNSDESNFTKWPRRTAKVLGKLAK